MPVNMKTYLWNTKLKINLRNESDFKRNTEKQRKSELSKSRLQRPLKSKPLKPSKISHFAISLKPAKISSKNEKNPSKFLPSPP